MLLIHRKVTQRSVFNQNWIILEKENKFIECFAVQNTYDYILKSVFSLQEN